VAFDKLSLSGVGLALQKRPLGLSLSKATR